MNEWMNEKENLPYYTMNEPWGYFAKQEKPDIEREIEYDSNSVKCFE